MACHKACGLAPCHRASFNASHLAGSAIQIQEDQHGVKMDSFQMASPEAQRVKPWGEAEAAAAEEAAAAAASVLPAAAAPQTAALPAPTAQPCIQENNQKFITLPAFFPTKE